MTFIAALRHDRIEAPWLLDRPINAERFQAYVENVLVPTLRHGDVVIADNLQSHKRQAIRKALRQVGAKLLFLPKYSPDLNPIEQVFAKLKHLLRKARARSKDAVCNAIATLLGTYTADECSNYFKNSGYGSTQTHHALAGAWIDPGSRSMSRHSRQAGSSYGHPPSSRETSDRSPSRSGRR